MEKSIKKRFHLMEYGVYVIFGLIFLVFAFSSKAFLNGNNLLMLVSNSASMMVICAGMTYVFITGAMDLSVGSVMLFSGMVINLLMENGVPAIVSVLAALAAGAGVGLINGLCITKLKANAFLVTYGTQIAVRGLALTLAGNCSVFTSQSLKDALRVRILGVPLFIYFAVILVIIAQYVLRCRPYGRKVIAVGCNLEGAARTGIPTAKIRASVFVVSGVCAAIAGLIMVVNVGNCTPYAGSGIEFTGAAAVLMGGTSMYGGKGSVIPGTIVGVFLLQIMENGLTILGINPYYLALVRGVLIFIAMFMDSLKNKRI